MDKPHKCEKCGNDCDCGEDPCIACCSCLYEAIVAEIPLDEEEISSSVYGEQV